MCWANFGPWPRVPSTTWSAGPMGTWGQVTPVSEEQNQLPLRVGKSVSYCFHYLPVKPSTVRSTWELPAPLTPPRFMTKSSTNLGKGWNQNRRGQYQPGIMNLHRSAVSIQGKLYGFVWHLFTNRPLSSTFIHFHPLSSTFIHFHPLSSTFQRPPVLARLPRQITPIRRIAVGRYQWPVLWCCLFAISIHAAPCSIPLKTGAKAGSPCGHLYLCLSRLVMDNKLPTSCILRSVDKS